MGQKFKLKVLGEEFEEGPFFKRVLLNKLVYSCCMGITVRSGSFFEKGLDKSTVMVYTVAVIKHV